LLVLGTVCNIADIGNACRKLEEYQEGKAELREILRAGVDLTPIGAVLGATEKAAGSTKHFLAAREALKAANEKNMEAFWGRWEMTLRKAGLDAAEARQCVATAVLNGNCFRASGVFAEGRRLRALARDVRRRRRG
jgi:hypothetical protein